MVQALGIAKALATYPPACNFAAMNGAATHVAARDAQNLVDRPPSAPLCVRCNAPATVGLATQIKLCDACDEALNLNRDPQWQSPNVKPADLTAAVRADAATKYTQARADLDSDIDRALAPKAIASETRTATDDDTEKCPKCGAPMTQRSWGYVRSVAGDWVKTNFFGATHRKLGHECSESCGHEDFDFIPKSDWREMDGEF
jgi:hypothetical protein